MVVGDLCLDEYIIGRARRLSREAPVPVLDFQRRFTVPGAAANPALNIASLGGVALMVGVVGDDEAGHALLDRLRQLKIGVDGIQVDRSRTTTVKTRVLAEVSLHFPQQIVRVDRQQESRPATHLLDAMAAYLEATIPKVDAVLLSDYKCGVVEKEVIETALHLARRDGKVITVDSQGDLLKFKCFTVVKCNKEEAEAMLRVQLRTEDSFRDAGHQLMKRLLTKAVLITRGSEGMSLIDYHGEYVYIPAANRSEDFDVTGAGDTVIAVLTLALAAGADVVEAAHISNQAAGLVVRKLGNATTTQEDLSSVMLARS